ncbi:hypothetical protein [Streptosporangium sp. NPDC051022]|uniref:hypothetical protein n=1 Tax=Streptosporangium sp. NPDC051022 TaxID=3155752 RepID=UPI00341DB9D7
MAADVDHVRRLCTRGDFPWAHSYVSRLIADRPGEPEPLLLRAMVHAHQGDPAAARRDLALADDAGGTGGTGDAGEAGGAGETGAVPLRAEVEALLSAPEDPVGGSAKTGPWRTAANALLAAVIVGVFFGVVDTALYGAGNGIADALGLAREEGGGSFPTTLIVLGMVALLRLLDWAVKARFRQDGIRADLRRRRDRARATAEGFDDDNMRLNAGVLASFLCVVPMSFPVPEMVGLPALSPVWPVLVVAALAGWICSRVGLRQVGRAFRLSRLTVVHTVVLLGWTAVFVAGPRWASSLDGGVGPYLVGWGLGGWLPSLPFLIAGQRRLRREGRLQVPAHWRGPRTGTRRAAVKER